MSRLPSIPSAESRLKLYVCRAKSCTRRGAGELAVGLKASLAEMEIDALVLRHDCFDLCKQACNVLVEAAGMEQRLYTQVHPKQAARFAESLALELRTPESTPMDD